jgi:hypothetical protein
MQISQIGPLALKPSMWVVNVSSAQSKPLTTSPTTKRGMARSRKPVALYFSIARSGDPSR